MVSNHHGVRLICGSGCAKMFCHPENPTSCLLVLTLRYFGRFEALEQLVLADRSQWKTILAKISINNSSLYNFLHLIHTNKNGCNSAEIEKIISQRDEPETQLRHRHFMDVFDKLPEGSRSELLSDLTSHMSLSLYDTKQDTSSSVATVGFVPVLLDQSVAYVHGMPF